MPIVLFCDEGLMCAFPGLAHADLSCPVKEHEGLCHFSIGRFPFVEGVKGQVQNPRAA
ncbi:MAG: hypothetical protein EWM73_01070 [Nitrospira sp.]|nr:MAG: hypothetical protein EWM73_01070 [Nitrospira sp.]